MNKNQLNLKDRRILHELDINARQSNSQIGKKIGMNKNTVNYRINRLVELGIIKGFYAEINMYKIGFKTLRIFIRFQNFTKELEKDFIDYFKNHEKVTWLLSVEGSYDIIMGVMARTNSEFYEFKEKLLYKYGQYISNIWYNLYVRMYQYKKSYLIETKKMGVDYKIMGGEQIAKIDETDDKILQILAVNSRIPLIELASKLKISPKVVAYRIKQLLKKDVLQSFRAMLDNNLLGYKWYKIHFWLKDVTEVRKKELEKFAHYHPNIVYINDTIGGADFEPEFHVKDEEELRKIISEIREKFADIIKNYDILHYYKIHKNLNYFPITPFL